MIIAEELGRYGVRANAIAPAARTRMTESTPGLSDHVVAPSDASVFDTWDPANISPLVASLAMEDCDITGQVFFVQGGTVRKFQNWTMTATLEKNDRWSVAELAEQLPTLLAVSEERRGAHVDREDADGLLNARTDPGSGAFGTLGTEAGSDLNWFSLLRTPRPGARRRLIALPVVGPVVAAGRSLRAELHLHRVHRRVAHRGGAVPHQRHGADLDDGRAAPRLRTGRADPRQDR